MNPSHGRWAQDCPRVLLVAGSEKTEHRVLCRLCLAFEIFEFACPYFVCHSKKQRPFVNYFPNCIWLRNARRHLHLVVPRLAPPLRLWGRHAHRCAFAESSSAKTAMASMTGPPASVNARQPLHTRAEASPDTPWHATSVYLEPAGSNHGSQQGLVCLRYHVASASDE